MSNIIQALEAEQMQREVPDFRAGDTVVVQVRVKEGERERLQAFEGMVIAKRNRGLNSAFTVRKMSHGEGVERVFQTYSPTVAEIDLDKSVQNHRPTVIHVDFIRIDTWVLARVRIVAIHLEGLGVGCPFRCLEGLALRNA